MREAHASTGSGEPVSESWQLGSRYVLERRIGAGSMGQVWSGHDVDGHHLAFKLLRSEFAEDPAVVSRFLQERTLLLSLRSPYVIRVYDLVIEGPRIALVLDFVDGPSLREVLNQQGNLHPSEVARLGAQMAHGLAAVHHAGILHRDFKPENVLLASSESGFVPKLVDFGIASLAQPGGQGGTANVTGTPQYLAPELGDGHPASPASDLYALGVALYEMCCGIVPFSAESPLALLRLHADHAPGRPDDIPEPLWRLMNQLMAKNPQDRPQDAEQVAEVLEQLAPQLRDVPQAPLLRVSPPTTRMAPAQDAASHSWGGPEHPSMTGQQPPVASNDPRTGPVPPTGSKLLTLQNATQLPGTPRPSRTDATPFLIAAAIMVMVLLVAGALLLTKHGF